MVEGRWSARAGCCWVDLDAEEAGEQRGRAPGLEVARAWQRAACCVERGCCVDDCLVRRWRRARLRRADGSAAGRQAVCEVAAADKEKRRKKKKKKKKGKEEERRKKEKGRKEEVGLRFFLLFQ